MKVVGIVCSPREGGNTEVMVREALRSAQEAGATVELISVLDKTITPCDGCETCFESGECQIKDDMELIYDKLLEADGIIFGTPVYFWNVSAQAKAIIDRSLALYSERRLAGKVAAAMVVAGRSGTTIAANSLLNFFFSHRMRPLQPVVGLAGDRGIIGEDESVMERVRARGLDIVDLVRQARAMMNAQTP